MRLAIQLNIEEADIGAALRSASAQVGHIYLADSNRVQPGLGHLNFMEVF